MERNFDFFSCCVEVKKVCNIYLPCGRFLAVEILKNSDRLFTELNTNIWLVYLAIWLKSDPLSHSLFFIFSILTWSDNKIIRSGSRIWFLIRLVYLAIFKHFEQPYWNLSTHIWPSASRSFWIFRGNSSCFCWLAD